MKIYIDGEYYDKAFRTARVFFTKQTYCIAFFICSRLYFMRPR